MQLCPCGVIPGMRQTRSGAREGEPAMRPRWTNRTIVKGLATSIVSAAALLVACEQTNTPTAARPPAVAFDLSNDPTTRWVNDDDPNGGFYVPPGTSCNDPGYASVGDAVTAPGSVARINVCPGTYQEQVTIPAGRDNLQLRSTKRWEAVIKAPAGLLPPQAIVRVSAAPNMTIPAFTITGPRTSGGTHGFGVRDDIGDAVHLVADCMTA